jgi:plastocyanin
MTNPTRSFDLGRGWRRLAAGVAVTWVVWAAALTAIIGEIEPFILVFGLVPVIAWAATRWKPGRTTYTIFGALGLATILLNLPFLVGSLSHPESAVGFNIDLVALLAALLQLSVGVRVWVPLSERFAAAAWTGAGVVFVAGLTLSFVAALGLEDDEPQSGDLRLVAEKLEFEPASLTSAAGPIGVFIENLDPGRHTFTLAGIVDLELPANTNRRAELDLQPGAYDIICAVPGHESMTATLTVTG